METGSRSGTFTFVFTDIEGSTRLWERDSDGMCSALASHNVLARAAVEGYRGTVVKMTGDGVYAAFADCLDALNATLQLQHALADPKMTHGVVLPVRCGLHAGVAERSDDDFHGNAVNRAARIMGAAHGGQILVSQAVVDLVHSRLPAEVSLRDLGTVWLRDIASPEHIYQVIHPWLRREFPALRSLETTPSNLPLQVTLFVGRERELADVKGLLADARLLTLVGIGGLGKTRLALQTAAGVIDDYRDGVWLVELAPLSDATLVPQAVASVLGVKEAAGHPVVEALTRHVKDRQLLLILDNCEHLVDACASLARQLLQSGSQLRVMASSREPLHVAGETTYSVPPLSVPDFSQTKTLTLAALTQFEAIHLFRDRAAAARPGFEVTDENAAAVTDICRRLDGMPLALELAAARVRTLSVQTIAARLSDRFRLLTGGDRTHLPRQQTLRALIDWSYDLLAEPEQSLLDRLSVFAGGWTLEAAESVGSSGDIEVPDVLDLLVRLVEKSLVARERDDRYRQLETVRQYAQERLTESGKADEVGTRHLMYFLALAEKASPQLVGPLQSAWLAQFDLERENLLAAHAMCDRADGGAELGLRLVHSIRLYWLTRGLLGLGHRVTTEALMRPGAQARNLARCRVLFVVGQLSFFMGRYGEAQADLVESLAIAREIEDKSRVAQALALLGVAYLGQKDLSTARGHLEEALALARELGDKVRLAGALNALAELRRAEGMLDTAEQLYEESLAIRRELGDRDAIAIDLLNLTVISTSRGLGERARRLLLEAFAIARQLGSKKLGQSVLDASAGLGAALGEGARAARFYGASGALMKEMGMHREPAVEGFLAPLIARAREEIGESAFVAFAAAGSALSYEDAITEAGCWLADTR
ncbi:MAG: tetratricopeptide repeat protein [Lysobacterales bacterium]